MKKEKKDDSFIVAGTVFQSRLIVGTGKFSSNEVMKEAVEASGAEMVTVALRRVNLNDPSDNLLFSLDFKKTVLLPNTSGAQNAEEAVRIARLAKNAHFSDWIKLEVIPDPKYLLPDGEETLKAAKILVQEGFKVMPYINADPVLAKKLEEVGTVSVMPLGSPIGSNKGLKTEEMLKIIIQESQIPVIVDAGIGCPSDASYAMELGADAVLINTAIAVSSSPKEMAQSFRLAVKAGRMAYLAGIAPMNECALSSSTMEWISRL